jgi:hypothetical protein
MTENKKTGAAKSAPFNPKKLTIEQQEAVVEEFLGIHPRYFIYAGQQIMLDLSRFEHENRNESARTGAPRKWFSGWKPNTKKYTG